MDSRAVTVTAVGDIMLGDNPHHIGRGVGSTWEYLSLENNLSHLKPYLSSDIMIGNLECTLGEISSKNPKRRAFVAPESRAKELKSLGFTHLGIANNHILEHGVHKAIQTKIALEKAGLVACGSINPVFETVNGNRIAIFCYSLEYEKRSAAWQGFQELIARDLPCTFLYNQKIIVAVRSNLRDIQIDHRGYLINIKEWWISSR